MLISRRTLRRLTAFVSVLLGFAGTLALGSVNGRISGTVKDPAGAVVPEAAVTAINMETGARQTIPTDPQGVYSFPSLPVGHYDLEIRKQGFKEHQETGLTLDVNTALRVDVSLELGAASQQVTVQALAVQVETTNTQMGEVISDTKMTTVPLNGRSYTDLLALQPGVVPVSSGQYNALSVSGNLNPGSLSVNGQRESANGFMVNGGNVEEATFGATAIIPNLDSIAEFRIVTNNVDAEYGNYSGGQINAITKSGTNQFHGDAFEFLRNTDLDARNFFSPDRGEFVQNQFGATAGGPIIKDKLFFFTDYQGTRQILGASTGDIAVPSAADRQGDLSDMASQLTGSVNGGYWAKQLSQKLGYGVTPGEPYYVPGCTLNSTCVFPNAVIPQSVITTPSQNLLKYIPLPNAGSFFSTSSDNQTLRDDKGSVRIDSNSRFGQISGYYFADDYTLNSPYATSSLPGFNDVTPGRAQMFNLSDTKTFGSTVVNEFRIHYMRMALDQNAPSGGLGPTLSLLGFVTGPNTSGIVVQQPQIQGVPPVSFNNYSIGVSGFAMHIYNNTYQLMDNLSIVRGSHTMKFGGGAHYDQVEDAQLGANNGTFNFSGVETGSDFADFLIGAPANYSQGAQLPYRNRTHYVGLFAQDSWRLTSNLTLNYGLRWDVTSPWSVVDNYIETIVPGLQSRVFPGAPTGWDFPGDPGIPRTIAPTRYDNLAPRVGLAYSPSASSGLLGRLVGGPGKTSIRAGYGIFYTSFEDVTTYGEIGDAPYGFWWSSPTPPLFTTPFVNRATGFNEGQRFPIVFPPSNVSASNPDNNVNWANFEPISGSPAIWHGNRVPYAEDYNLSIQRQIGMTSLLSVSYVGTQGHALMASLEANPGNQALCLSVSQPSQVLPGGATCGPFGENGVYTTAAGKVINGTRAPLGNDFGSNPYYITIGNSNYNSLQVAFRHRSGPFEFLAGYTFSKSIDDGSGYSEVLNPFNYRLSRAISAFDVPNNFVVSYYYELPLSRFFGSNRMSSGWKITGITRFSTGLPITLSETDDRSLLGINYPFNVPSYTPGNLEFNDPRSGLPYFNPSLFSADSLGQLGTAGRRMFFGPGINNWDMALLKDTRITESKILQFRFEFFNIGNHAQFNNPVGNIDNSQFGYVTSARDPRIGQAALKFIF